MIYYLFLTAFTVSIDSFFCGFSLPVKKGKKLLVILLISLTVFIMCLFTNYFIKMLSNKFTDKASIVGGIILIEIGIINFIKKQKTQELEQKNLIKQSLLVGFAVGIDGAIANLSLSLMNINSFFVPLTIAIMHGIMIYFGTTLKCSKFGEKIEKINFISPLILIILGLYKIIPFL